ncbi:MAG: DNA-3-methyladenine glycosylase [Candidatus Kaelpia aquatica]|nr:DNA-3-methyladenine glycosylase [Candidatus Kaelpia aquatica]
MEHLEEKFFQRPAKKVAQELLGQYLVREHRGVRLVVKIVEVEGYLGVKDKASHAYGGRQTKRNSAMYQRGGVFYVYKIYGLYHCLNVVTGIKDAPQAVLIRAVEPIEGAEQLQKNRTTKTDNKNLTNGPGKLTQAMKIDLNFNFQSVENKELYFLKGEKIKINQIIKAPRINIDYAEECKDLPLRFYLKGNRFISAK